jgi:hypothetical protein
MSIYTKHDFLGCHDCALLQVVVYESGMHFDEAVEEAVQAYREFMASHASHRTAEFHRSNLETHSDRPLWDPMATITFEVTDGHDQYLVHATRASIDEPRVYRFTRGCLEVQCTGVAIDDSDVRRGLDLEFYPHVLRPTKLDQFVSLLHQVISHINPDELAIAFDAADDPAISVAPMPDVVSQEILVQCQEIFDPWEFSRVSTFVHNNRDEHGLLALRVHRQLSQLTA